MLKNITISTSGPGMYPGDAYADHQGKQHAGHTDMAAIHLGSSFVGYVSKSRDGSYLITTKHGTTIRCTDRPAAMAALQRIDHVAGLRL